MNVKIKSSVILLLALMIGVVIGAIIGSHYGKRSVYDRMSKLRTEEGFIHRFERSVKPTDEQKTIVREILVDHFKRIKEISSESRTNIKIQNDSLALRLEPILSEEQMKRLHRRLESVQRFSRKDKKKTRE